MGAGGVPMPGRIRPLPTVIAALLGSIIGGLVFAFVMDRFITPMLASEGMTGLAEMVWSLQALNVGIFVGAAVAIAITFRDEPARTRFTPVVLLLLAAALFLVGVLSGALSGAAPWWAIHPLFLLVVSPALALLGRYLAVRSDEREDRRAGPRHPRT